MTSALVVGAGVFGLSTARALAGRGWQVQVVDRREPGTGGPSAAESRVLRSSHGPDAWYTRLAWQAQEAWRKLEAETGAAVLHRCGVLLLATDGPGGTEWESASLATLRDQRIPVDLVEARRIERRFPVIGAQGVHFALFEPEAGVLLARQATLALAASAQARGVAIRRAEARPHPSGVLIDGALHTADLVVWAAGSGLVELFGALSSARVVEEDSLYLEPEPSRAAEFAAAPVWLDRQSDFYGVPALGPRGVKVGPADAGLADKLACRVPGLAAARHVEVEPCHWTAMPDEHFLLAAHPDRPGQWLVGGDGGRGFKHGPAWGEYVVDVVEGLTPPLPRFALR
jgi:sarcosine oxidase